MLRVTIRVINGDRVDTAAAGEGHRGQVRCEGTCGSERDQGHAPSTAIAGVCNGEILAQRSPVAGDGSAEGRIHVGIGWKLGTCELLDIAVSYAPHAGRCNYSDAGHRLVNPPNNPDGRSDDEIAFGFKRRGQPFQIAFLNEAAIQRLTRRQNWADIGDIGKAWRGPCEHRNEGEDNCGAQCDRRGAQAPPINHWEPPLAVAGAAFQKSKKLYHCKGSIRQKLSSRRA